MLTNIINVLENAQIQDNETTLRVLNLSEKEIIPDLFVRCNDGFDHLIFDFADSNPTEEFVTEYNSVHYAIGKNNLTDNNALHIRIDSNNRARISQFYEDLCLGYDSAATEESVWSVIEDWAEIFKKINLKRMSNEEEIGLFGELVVFEKLMQFHADILDIWEGPSGGLHDFIDEDNWELEVKTSLNPNPVVKIHPINQLEPISEPFHLVVVKLKSDRENGISLPEKIDQIRTKLADGNLVDEFNNLLLDVEYREADRDKYKRKFSHIECLKYKIDDDTITLCPHTIGEQAKYLSVRWTLQVSDYPMVTCEDSFWQNPAV